MNKKLIFRLLSNYYRFPKGSKLSEAQRFENFQLWLLHADLPKNIHLFLSLFAFDGLRVCDLPHIKNYKPLKYDNSRVGLPWVNEEGRQQRLWVSNITLRLMKFTDWSQLNELDVNCISKYYQIASAQTVSIEQFSKDQNQWFSEIASGPIADHFLGVLPMTALADQCYIRLLTKQALLPDPDTYENNQDDLLFLHSLEGWLEPLGNDANPVVVSQIKKICSRGRVDDRQSYKSQLLKRCQDILSEANNAGPITSLILCWVIDLILNGTANKKSIAVSTLVNYMGILAEPIFLKLRGHDVGQWPIERFEEVYDSLIEETKPGLQNEMKSAILAFHHFLVNWLEVPQLTRKKHNYGSIPIPMANILWKHEYELILNWLSDASIDPRLKSYLKGIVNIAYQIRIRISELLKLRLSDIKIFGDNLQISIRGTKSASSKRRVEININQCTEFYELFLSRLNEWALTDDYVFGDPNRLGRIYSLAKIYTALSQLLKSATGDRTIRFHAFSHTLISMRLKNLIVGGGDDLVNPLHQQSSDFGHYSILTSCSSYMHLYEDAIRNTIDRSLRKLEISYDIAAKWCDISAAALRKKASRSKLPKNEVIWDSIFGANNEVQVDCVTHNIACQTPQLPTFLTGVHTWQLLRVLHCMQDIEMGLPISTIALRQSLDELQIKQLLIAIKNVLIKLSCSKVNFNFSTELLTQEVKNAPWMWVSKACFEKNKQLICTAQKVYKSSATGLESWFQLLKYGYISFEDTVNADLFIKLLSILGVPLTHLGIAISSDTYQGKLRGLQASFYEYFHATVPHFNVQKRRGRPDIYLLYSSQRVTSQIMPSPASLANAGLNAVLFGMAVLLEIDND